MASAMATKRLRKEYLALQKKPVDNIIAVPLETNILEWHYVITGPNDSPYAGGHYHGKLKFPPEYPMKPPSVFMLTENGRFKTNTRLCLSMSDFHPETWNPMWSVSSILTGLLSFMLENQPTLGSITTSESQRRHFAAISLENNCKNALFCKLFPELVTLHKKREEERAYLKALQEAARETLGHSPIDPTKPNQDTNDLMDTKKKKIKEVYQFIEENNVSILVGISILLFVLCAYLVLL